MSNTIYNFDPMQWVRSSSCCGGFALWSVARSQWECEKCRSVVSNDPNYLYTSGSGVISSDKYGQKYEPYHTPEKKCVCGGEKAKTTHAHWCEVSN